MDFKKIITDLLGLQDVIVEDVKLFKKDLRLEVKVRHNRDECFCTTCGLQFSHIKEWVLKNLKAPPMGIFQEVNVTFFQLRGRCEDCQKTEMAESHWIHPKFTSMTCGFAEVAGRLMEEITCEAVGRILHVDPMTMWRLDQWRMEFMLTKMKLPKNLDISYLSADEVHHRTEKVLGRRGLVAKRSKPKFITNLVCYEEGKILFNAEGRDSAALEGCLHVLSAGQKLAVEKFAVDMHEPFMSVIKTECPNADVVVDRFHVAQKVNEAFDSVRKIEFRKARQRAIKKGRENTDLESNMLLPHRRFILVSRKKHLSKEEEKLLTKLRKANQNIDHALYLVEYFHKALDNKTIKGFRRDLCQWYQVAREAKLKPFRKLAKTIRRYRRNIEAYIQSRLTTAVSEGLNNKIKTLKRMGYGYTSARSFRLKILQRCGYLNHLSINTDEFFIRAPNPAI